MTEQNLKKLAQLHDENTELKKEIERLKAEREWISVKQRLPDNNIYVIVRMDGGSVDTDYLTSANEFDFFGRFVTHWMPLPQHPKQ